MSKQTLGFIMTWTNNTQSQVIISGVGGAGNSNWNDTNGSGVATFNDSYTLQPGQSLTVTSNVENCSNNGFQYILISTPETSEQGLPGGATLGFAQTYLGWESNKYGGVSQITTCNGNGSQEGYSTVSVQTNMSDASYSYPWGAALCYLNTIATEEVDGSCVGGFASGNNADANMTLNGSVAINGLTPADVMVLGLVVNYPS